jgi:hypothetical protein
VQAFGTAFVGVHYWFENEGGVKFAAPASARLGTKVRMHFRGNTPAFLTVWMSDWTHKSLELTTRSDAGPEGRWTGYRLDRDFADVVNDDFAVAPVERASRITVAALTSTAPMCPGDPPAGNTGLSSVHHLPQATSYFCVPATVLMWRNYAYSLGTTGDTTQFQVWDYMKANYPSQTIDGVGAGRQPRTSAANRYIGNNVTLQDYHDNGPDDCNLRQMVRTITSWNWWIRPIYRWRT